MYIRDYMQTNVITIPSDTLITDAQQIMRENNIHRLPVVDDGKLVGIVTRTKLRDVAPSQATSVSIWELNFTLSKIKVKEVMDRDVITTTPDTPVEEAALLGAQRGVGALPVVEGDKLVGIITQSDLYRIVVDVLGANQPGYRLRIIEPYEGKPAGGVGQFVGRREGQIMGLFTYTHPKTKKQEMIVRVVTNDIDTIVEDMRKAGYEVELMR